MERFDLGGELRQIVKELRHLQNEHAREGQLGSWRRHFEAEVRELEERFEALVQRWIKDDALRERWRAHLYHFAEEPDAPVLAAPPEYKGRSPRGILVAIHRSPVGDWQVSVDEEPPERVALPPVLDASFVHKFELEGMPTEVFDAPEEALRALADHSGRASGAPPWQWAPELYEDGLIDVSFNLTPRGRRFVASRRGAVEVPTLT